MQATASIFPTSEMSEKLDNTLLLSSGMLLLYHGRRVVGGY